MRIGFLVFDQITQLDLTGPLQVFSQAPGYACHLVAGDLTPRPTDGPLTLAPTTTFDAAPAMDMVCVPGGYGVAAAMADEETLDWLKAQATTSRWITSVCTGAFILGAAGLLKGRKATTHWAYHDLLARFGATPLNQRVVFDGPVVTGGGVTAGIDFALEILARESGEATAKTIQLVLEYDPSPRFEGSPDTADGDVLSALNASVYDARRAVMGDAVARAVEKLASR
jgi:cyclohexyl-isocyanide hydratase